MLSDHLRFTGNRGPGSGASSKIWADSKNQGVSTSTLITASQGFSKWSSFAPCITETRKLYMWPALARAQASQTMLRKSYWQSARACQHYWSSGCCCAHSQARKELTRTWWGSSTSSLLLLSLPPLGHLWPRVPNPKYSETQGDASEPLANDTITTSPQHSNSFCLSHQNWHQERNSWNTSVKYYIWNLHLP